MRPYTLQDVLDPYTQYPKTIQQAILLAHTHPAFLALTRTMRKVLCAMLTRASQRNGEMPIKARIDRLAIEAGVSTKSVQRAIATFQEFGWLSLPTEEARSEYGLFCSRLYQFTTALCQLVRLPTDKAVSAPSEISFSMPVVETPPVSETDGDAAPLEISVSAPIIATVPDDMPRETEMSDGAVYVDLTFKEDQRKISQENSKGKPVNLPLVLKEASAEFSIRETGIAALRGIAYATGHQLEEIVMVARDYLKKAGSTGHRAYRYLETMARKPRTTVDYSARAQQMERLAAVTASSIETQSLELQYRYKTFIGPGGIVVRIFDGVAEIQNNGKYSTVPKEGMAQIYERIQSGWLKERVG